MIKGMFTSASGMLPGIKRQELTANNVANTGTSGFKRDDLFTRELTKAERRLRIHDSDRPQPMAGVVFTDYDSGVFDRTDNPLNLAIDGDGFFTLQLEDGSLALTRNGAFNVNSDGLLAHPDGPIVVAEGAGIEVGNGKVVVSSTGEVEVDGFPVARITPQTVADVTVLEKIGRAMFRVPEDAELITVDKANIRQGYLETSNVDIVSEMVEMIIAYRTYEANAKALQSQDGSLEHLLRRVGADG